MAMPAMTVFTVPVQVTKQLVAGSRREGNLSITLVSRTV